MELIAEKREQKGKEVKALRKALIIPAVLIEKAKESINLSVKLNEFLKVYKESGETSLVDLNVQQGTSQKVLIDEVQLHPITLKPNHVVFRKVDLANKLTVNVPVELINEEENPLVKSKEGLILKLLDEIEVEALPTDLPQAFIVDALKLKELGDVVTVGQLEYDRKKIEIKSHDEQEPLVKLEKVQEQEEELEVTEEEALAKVTATEELTDEQKAQRQEEKQAKPGDND